MTKGTAEELITQEMFDDAKFVLNFVPGPWTAHRTLLALRGAIVLVEHEVERLVREAARGR